MFQRFRSVYITFSLSACFVVFLVFFNISHYFGINPLNNAANTNLMTLFPQGWSFFTRSSENSLMHLYKITDGNMTLVNQRNFSAQYLFGLNRSNRILSHELSFISGKATKDSAKTYKLVAGNVDDIPRKISCDTLQYCRIQVAKEVVPDLAGKYLIVYQSRLPWYLLHKKPDFNSNFIIQPVDIHYL